jgi:hypothetical protein
MEAGDWGALVFIILIIGTILESWGKIIGMFIQG